MAKSSLLSKEDYWAIWIGAALLIFGLIAFFINKPEKLEERHAELETLLQEEANKAPFKTMAWQEAFNKQKGIKAASEPIGKTLKKLTTKPGSWSNNPLQSFIISEADAAAKKKKFEAKYSKANADLMLAKRDALFAENKAASAGFKDEKLNEKAIGMSAIWQELNADFSKLK